MSVTLRNFYAQPLSFMDMLVECSQFIDHARQDPGCSKMDALESLENRLSLLIGKLAGQPTCTEFTVFPTPAQAEEDEEPALA